MKMKNYILRMLSGVAILAATVVAVSVNAANGGIKETREYPVCYGDTLRLGDKVITRDTIWRDTMHSYEPGQDSVYVYVVHFGPMPAIQTESQVLAVGSSFMWHGLLVDHPGDYLKVYKSKSGCDSVLYKLTVTPEYASTYYYVEKDTTICEGESVMWRGAGRTISRTYVDTAHATLPQEQDTIYVLYLHVAKPFYQTEMMETSQFPFTYRGETFNAAGSRDVTYTSAAGCDSTYHIIVNQQQLTKHEYATICANDDQGYTWDRTHETYFEPSTYYHRIPSEYDPSKDSIVYVLHLSVAHTPNTTINETICFGETYYLNGKPYKTTGQYKQSLKTVDNCDSLVVLNLTVNYPIVHDTVKVTYNGVGAYQWKFNHEGDPQNVACNGSGIYPCSRACVHIG